MKEVLSYIAFDGRTFTTEKDCRRYEESALDSYRYIMPCMGVDLGSALVKFLQYAEKVIGTIVASDKYVKLFQSHAPCAVHCLLYKVFDDYRNDYPHLFEMYLSLMRLYSEKYGPAEKEE